MNKEVFTSEVISRYRGVYTEEQLGTLENSRVAVVGLSVGSNVAVTLARAGIGSMLIADPAEAKVSGIGRSQVSARDIGRKKIDVVSERLGDINPFMTQIHLPEGITKETVENLTEYDPDIVVDEVDNMYASLLLRQYCQERSKPYVTAADVSRNVVLEIIRHDKKQSPLFASRWVSKKLVERLSKGALSEEDQITLFAQTIGWHRLAPDLIATVMRGDPIPQLGSTAMKTGGYVAESAIDILTDNKAPKTGIRTIASPGKRYGVRDWLEVARVFAENKRTS